MILLLAGSTGVDVTDTGPPLWIFVVILAVLLVPYGVFLLRRYLRRLPEDLPWPEPDPGAPADPRQE